MKALLPINLRPGVTERVVECQFALRCLVHSPGRMVLDIGQGPCPAFWYLLNTIGYECLGTDAARRGTIGLVEGSPREQRHLFRIDDIVRTRLEAHSFDAVTCISTLEHIAEYEQAVRNMKALLTAGGVLIVTIPYSDDRYLPNVFDPPSHPPGTHGYTQSFSREIVEAWGAAVEKVYWKCWTGCFWRQGERLRYPIVTDPTSADLVGICLRV